MQVTSDAVEYGTSSGLPHWLHFDAHSSLLEGVPIPTDAHTTFTIRLLTTDSDQRRPVDQFQISVIEDSPREHPDSAGSAPESPPGVLRCLPTSAVTTATVVIDADAAVATGDERAATLRAFARFLDLPVAAVRYLPAGRAPLEDSSALVAGVGDAGRRRAEKTPGAESKTPQMISETSEAGSKTPGMGANPAVVHKTPDAAKSSGIVPKTFGMMLDSPGMASMTHGKRSKTPDIVSKTSGEGSETPSVVGTSPGVVLEWEVGCGNVFSAHMDRLERLEKTAADGSMSTALGHGVVGWLVANKRPHTGSRHHHAQRSRRAAVYGRLYPTATPVLVVTPPTSRPVMPTYTVKEPDPTRGVPPVPTRVVYTTSSATTTPWWVTAADPSTTRRRRRRTGRPRGRTTIPVTEPPTNLPYLEPSTTERVLTTTRMVVAPTPPLPPPRVPDDFRWSGEPLRLDLYTNDIIRRDIPVHIFVGASPGSKASFFDYFVYESISLSVSICLACCLVFRINVLINRCRQSLIVL